MERKIGLLIWEKLLVCLTPQSSRSPRPVSLFPLVPQNLFSFGSVTQQPGVVTDCMALIIQKHPEYPHRQLWFSLIPLFAQGQKLKRGRKKGLPTESPASLSGFTNLMYPLSQATGSCFSWSCQMMSSCSIIHGSKLLLFSSILLCPFLFHDQSGHLCCLPACLLFLIHPNCCLPPLSCSTLVSFCPAPQAFVSGAKLKCYKCLQLLSPKILSDDMAGLIRGGWDLAKYRAQQGGTNRHPSALKLPQA